MSNDNFDKVKEIILEINDEAVLNENTDLVEDEVLDSLETVTFLSEIEEEFDISISTEDYMDKELFILKNLIEFIKQG